MLVSISKEPFTVAGKSGYHYKIDGKRKSLSTDSLPEAKKRLAAVRRLYFQGKLAHISGEARCSKALRDFADDYLEWAEKTRPRSSYRADKLALAKLGEVAGWTIRMDALTLRHIDAIKALPVKATSANVYIRHLRALFHKAVEWSHLPRNPFAAAKQLPVDTGPPVYIAPGDVLRFLASIKDMDCRRLVTAYIYSGRRRGELIALDWADVDMVGEVYTIRQAKNRRGKVYAMHPMVKAVLRAIGPREAGPVFDRWRHPDAVTHVVKRALVAFGLGHVHLHHMRHTFAVLLREEGVDIKTISDLMGHTDVRATQIYAHITDTAAATALRRIKGGPVEL